MLNAKSSENFQSPDQNWANFGGCGGLRVSGFKKLQFLPQKARPCVNPRRLSHFASKSVEECDFQVGWGKKVKKSHRDFRRKDMSPLTQSLNYRSACDNSRDVSLYFAVSLRFVNLFLSAQCNTLHETEWDTLRRVSVSE